MKNPAWQHVSSLPSAAKCWIARCIRRQSRGLIVSLLAMLHAAIFGAAISVSAMSVLMAPAIAEEPARGLEELVPKLLPAVVNIFSTRFPDAPVQQGTANPAAPTKPRPKRSLGSGFVIDPSGIIVTNQHVIKDADEISVTLQDNSTLRAAVIGASPIADLAVLKVSAVKPLPTVGFGDSRATRVGETVIAIGNPLGLGGSVSAGIVSALNRDILASPYDDYIQTDTAINHGNSGGPLFNLRGEVIGVNTALYAPAGQTGSIGLGFAIPANDAQFVIRQLIENGTVRAGFLGAHIQRVTQDIAAAVGLDEVRGALVDDVVPGGPASKAGLRYGDVIMRAGGQDLSDPRAVARTISQTPIGDVVDLLIWRDGGNQEVQVTVAEWPGDPGQATGAPSSAAKVVRGDTASLGLQLSALTGDLRQRYNVPAEQEGVLVTAVDPWSTADERGIRGGDLVLKVQMAAVRTPGDLIARLQDLRLQGRRYVLLLVRDEDGNRSVALPLGDN
jgi:serine protease Do